MARLFFALWPDEEIRDQIDKVSRQFDDTKIKLVKKSNLHITLVFLGEVAEQDKDELIEKINKLHMQPFELELTRTGWWRKPQILWIGTSSVPEELLQLVKSIRKCVNKQGLKAEKREYQPHITIARKAKHIKLTKDTLNIKWKVDSFALMKSSTAADGVNYEVIREWPLLN